MKNLLILICIFNLNLLTCFSQYDQDDQDNQDNFNIFDYPEYLSDLNKLFRYSLFEVLHDVSDYNRNDKWRENIAYTRISNELSDCEKNYLQHRDIITKKALEKISSQELKDNSSLRIALCLSGGGYRSLISSLGYMSGLQEAGLLDAVTYITAISGSTWAISSLYSHDLDLDDLISLIKNQVSRSIYSNFDSKLLIESAVYKLFWGQKINFVGIWGTILANTFFSDNYLTKVINKNIDNFQFNKLLKTKIPKLSQFQKKIENGLMPMPIFSAVMIDRGYDWIEFNPYEIGISNVNTYISSWGLSRKFKNGISIDSCPEVGLDYLMGIWGSAFTVSTREVLEIYSQSIPSFLFQVLDTVLVPEGNLSSKRISPATLPNFAYSIPGHPLRDCKDMTLVDAGISCNLPVAPIFKHNRQVDLIIIIDASCNAQEAKELKRAQVYADTYGISLPELDYSNINTINIFKDYNKNIPVIIYMPLIKNTQYSINFDPSQSAKDGYCSTFNLKYTAEQFDELFGLGKANLKDSLKEITKTIEDLLLKKNMIK